MSQINADDIRQISIWLKRQSVSSNASYDAPVTKQDLENLRNTISIAIAKLADVFEC